MTHSFYTLAQAQKNLEKSEDWQKKLELAGALKKGVRDFENLSPCLMLLLAMLKPYLNLEYLSKQLPSKKEALTLPHFMNVFVRLGFDVGYVTGKIDDIDLRLFPVLFLRHENIMQENDKVIFSEPLVILGREEEEEGDIYYIVFNPCADKLNKLKRVAHQEINRGNIYFFTPKRHLAHQRRKEGDDLTKDYKDAFSIYLLLKRFKGLIAQILLMSVMIALASLASPLFVMIVYDKVVSAHSLQSLPFLVMGVLLAIVFEMILRGVRARFLVWLSTRMNYLLTTKTFAHLLNLSPVYTENAAVSAQVSRFRAIESVRTFLNSSAFSALLDLPAVFVILLAIYIVGGDLFFVSLFAVVGYFLMTVLMYHFIARSMKKTADFISKRQQLLVETFEKNSAIRSAGLGDTWIRQLRDVSGRAALSSFRSTFRVAILEALAQAMFTGCALLTIVTGVYLIWQGQMFPGALIAVMILSWRLLSTLQNISTSAPRFIQLKNTLQQFERLFKIQTESSSEKAVDHFIELSGEIHLNKLGLRYTKETDPIFTGLTLFAPKGSIIAITGGNGAGKSTILKLINGMYRPQAGSVRLDGVDIRQYDPAILRAHIGYMPQIPQFFEGTVEENLRFVKPLATKAQIEDALHNACALEDVLNLPHGLKTLMSDEHSVSMILKYQISLARTYLQDAPLMLLDELPYALLNSHIGENFYNFIRRNKGRKTIFFITHRQDYLDLATSVILLDNTKPPYVGTSAGVVEQLRIRREKKYENF